jgi:hypothetical protein
MAAKLTVTDVLARGIVAQLQALKAVAKGLRSECNPATQTLIDGALAGPAEGSHHREKG